MHDSVLVSLAMLNINWDEAHISYVHNFIPFVADCLQRSADDVVSVPVLQEALAKDFGLQIPLSALQGIVNRAAKDGLLYRESGVLKLHRDKLGQYDLNAKRATAVREHDALVAKLVEYALQDHGAIFSSEEAEGALLGFVADRTLPIMRSVVLGETYQSELGTGSAAEYIVSSFIAHLFERDPSGFTYLETVVKGSMLATALYLPNPGSQTGRLPDLYVYLDTPLLLRALGYEGAAAGAAAQELLTLLRNLGARLGCFQHTEVEIRNVLGSCASSLRSPRRRNGENPMRIVEHCLREHLGPSEIDRRIEKLPKDLERLGVAIFTTPVYSVATTIDEGRLEEVLQDVVRYHRDETRLYDLKSLVAINHLRRGRIPTALDQTPAIFVTTNASLARGSRQFFNERPTGDLVPVCAVDHEIATVAWLKQPVDAPDLPRKQILADCYAAMYPGEPLWRLYLEEVERLRADETLSEDDYYVLRFSVEARRALMEETLGREDAFTVGTIEDVLRRAQETQHAVLFGQLKQANSETDSERVARESAEALAAEATEKAEAATRSAEARVAESDAERSGRVSALAERIAKPIANVALVVGSLAVLVVVLLTMADPFPNLLGRIGGIGAVIFGVAVMAVAVLGVLNLSIGTSVRSLAHTFQRGLAGQVERFLRKHL